MAIMPRRSLRTRRIEHGLTQGDLAARAGVSRQLVAAVEAGRNAPAVDAALRLAAALHTTAEALFGESPTEPATPALGGGLADGAAVRAGRVGDRLVTSELTDHGVAGMGWAKPDGTVTGGVVRLFPGARPAATVIAGCDPALGLVEALLEREGPCSLLAVPAPTGTALAALDAGRVHGAVVHNLRDQLPQPPVPVNRWHLARWQVGLGIPTRRRDRGIAALLRGAPGIVQRDAAASSQQAFLRAAAATGVVPPVGPIASGHIDAARIAALTGTAAVTTEAAARCFGLAFTPLEDHTVEIWIAEQWAELPGIVALGEVLTSGAFAERIARVGGYDLTGCGAPVSAAA
jgi:DNA-binding XRE family transcriptional regulator